MYQNWFWPVLNFFFFSIFFINYHNTFWQFHIFYLSMLTALLISLGINGPCNKFNIELKNIRPTQKLARHLYALVMFNCYFNLVYIHIILKVMDWKYQHLEINGMNYLRTYEQFVGPFNSTIVWRAWMCEHHLIQLFDATPFSCMFFFSLLEVHLII